MGIATTALRVTMGGVMAGHGLQKLAGKFGGPGLDATAAGFEQIGFHPGLPYARAAAVTETVGGGLIALGALTPVGASMVTGTMGVAIMKVHGPNGLWVTKGGYEYNLMLIAASFALTEVGPGHIALDGIIFKKRHGVFWAVLELAAGLGGAAIVAQLASRGAKAFAAANPTTEVTPVADNIAQPSGDTQSNGNTVEAAAESAGK
jgi:putative oxidoreductase